MQKVGKPWQLLAASFVLIAIPLMAVMRSDVALSPSESTRLAFKVTAWGAIVPAIALMIAKLLEQADANSPHVAALLIVPLAAFAFRASQFVRKARSGAC